MATTTKFICIVLFIVSPSVWAGLHGQFILRQKDCLSGPFSSYEKVTSYQYGKLLSERMRSYNQERFSRHDFNELKNRFICKIFVYSGGPYPVGAFMLARKSGDYQHMPTVIYNRGGNGRYGAIGYGGIVSQLLPLAEQGAVVFASQYRGGMPLTDGPGERVDEFGGKDVNDIVNLVAAIKDTPYFNSANVNMVGASRGGMMAMEAAKVMPYLHSMTLIGAPTDLFDLLSFRPGMAEIFKARIPDYIQHKKAELKKRSAVFWVNAIAKSIPILILHGTKDERVPVRQAKALYQKLKRTGHQVKLQLYKDGHGLSLSRVNMYKQINALITARLPQP